MISSIQALLARTMLRLSQKEVAQALGMAHTTLSNIENGTSDAPASRYHQIQAYYEQRGIEFLEGNGLRERRSYIKRYNGIEGFRLFMDDVYQTAQEYGGPICLFNSRPRIWQELLGEDWYAMHAKRMEALKDKITVRIVVPEGEQHFILGLAQHKWFPKKKQWQEKVFYAYGPKLGFLDFSNDHVAISVLHQADFADEFRLLFDIAWEHVAFEPPEYGGNE